MVKRGNDTAQLSKEELAALESETPESTPTGSFVRASDEVLSGRKIVKASRASLEGGTPSSTSTPAPAKVNPFAKVSFADKVPAPTAAAAAAAAAPKEVTFAPTSPVSPEPTMKPGHILKRTPAPESFKNQSQAMKQPATSTFVGIPTPARPSTANTTELSKQERLDELNTAFRAHVATLPIQGCEWTSVMQQYLAYHDAITSDGVAEQSTTTSTASATSSATTSANKFNFGNATSIRTLAPVPVTTPAQSIGTLSPSSAAAADDDTPTTSSSSSSNNNNNKDKDDKFYEVRGRYLLWDGKTWNGTKTGHLALEYDANGKRIVIRNATTFTVSKTIALPQELKKVEQKTTKGETKRFIQFVTNLDGTTMPIRLQTAHHNIDVLYEKICELRDKP